MASRSGTANIRCLHLSNRSNISEVVQFFQLTVSASVNIFIVHFLGPSIFKPFKMTPTHPPANGFVAAARKVYNPIGFSKGYNFILFFIFCGAMMGFALARFQFVNFNGIFCGPASGRNHALPGECYYYRMGHEKIGIIAHLGCIMPASVLVCFQFVPAIRHKALIFHRINGYIIIALSLVGTAGAIMAARSAFGGGLDVQTVVGFLSIVFVISLVMGYINIKRLQLQQHRAWMLRAWFYVRSISYPRHLFWQSNVFGPWKAH